MSTEKVVIATRQSRLALWQAHFIQDQLHAAHRGLSVELLGITTKGDKWLDSPLADQGGKGLFIKELEQALLNGEADMAVHSVKDVPAEIPEAFAMPVLGFREDVRDALISASGTVLESLPKGARIGSSSLRRQAQILAVRDDLIVLPIRGNVETRLKKLDDGEFDAIVLAAAGLNRLGLSERISELLACDVCLPAAGQGALGIECRAGDVGIIEMLGPLQDNEVHACVTAERMVSQSLGADCTAPLAAHAVFSDGQLTLRARVARPDGTRVLRAEAAGEDPVAVGEQVSRSLLAQGAAELLGTGG
jgi:hydroxymethylbilane synthase